MVSAAPPPVVRPATSAAYRGPVPVIDHISHPDRLLPFRSAVNFRDLGGYPAEDGRSVRWQRLYRAGALHWLAGAEDDLAELRRRGLRTVVDLRTAEERDRGRFSADLVDAVYHHLPVLPEIWSASERPEVTDAVAYFTARYREMLEVGAPAFAAGLSLLAHDVSYPLVFHCTAGKDRTGVFAMLVLGLLGVDRAVIAADYHRSAAEMDRLVDLLQANAAERSNTMAPRVASPLMGAPEEAMLAVLGGVATDHGSVSGYVRSIGVTTRQMEQIRAALLE